MRAALFGLIALFFGGTAIAVEPAAPLKAGVFTPARMAPDFTLAGSDGTALSLRQFRGKVVLLGFGFTHCTEVCPVTLTTLAATQKQLSALADGVQVVYITVDPERDDAARMRQYLSAFNPGFIGGTGTPEQLATVRRDFGIMAERKAGPDGDYSHSSFVYLIDKQGQLRALMPYGHAPADYVHDVRILLGTP